MAVDSQGADASRKFAEPVADAITVLVDADNQLAEHFGFKAIPNGIFVSPEQRIDAIKAGRFDVRRPEIRELVENWAAGSGVPIVNTPDDLQWSDAARDLFLEAGAAVRSGNREEAIRLLKLAHPLEPDNLIIRKQLWAIENPERFYSGDIDREWQQDRLERGE